MTIIGEFTAKSKILYSHDKTSFEDSTSEIKTSQFRLHWFHCVKIVRFEFSGPYFPAFGLNTERYAVSQSKCGKMQTRKIPNTDSFYAVLISKPTYLWQNSSSCIDLIFTSQPKIVVESGFTYLFI